jgi:hypothetical protein
MILEITTDGQGGKHSSQIWRMGVAGVFYIKRGGPGGALTPRWGITPPR